MKAIGPCFPCVTRGVLPFEYVDGILFCDHWIKSHRSVLFSGAVSVNYVTREVLSFKSVDETFCVTIQLKAIEQYFPMMLVEFQYMLDLRLGSW